jgi:hypothetical protein
MKFSETILHCSDELFESFKLQIEEIRSVLKRIDWSEEFTLQFEDSQFANQRGYNKAFEIEFEKLGWESQPKLRESPNLVGDFRKGLVFIEVQFGNSSTLYRDFYKFQYGVQNGLLSLAVLIVPKNEYDFFPTRRSSVQNMANSKLAESYFTVLPINVPTMVFGLLPEND